MYSVSLLLIFFFVSFQPDGSRWGLGASKPLQSLSRPLLFDSTRFQLSSLFLDCVATFTCTELFSFQRFIFFTVVIALIAVDRACSSRKGHSKSRNFLCHSRGAESLATSPIPVYISIYLFPSSSWSAVVLCFAEALISVFHFRSASSSLFSSLHFSFGWLLSFFFSMFPLVPPPFYSSSPSFLFFPFSSLSFSVPILSQLRSIILSVLVAFTGSRRFASSHTTSS